MGVWLSCEVTLECISVLTAGRWTCSTIKGGGIKPSLHELTHDTALTDISVLWLYFYTGIQSSLPSPTASSPFILKSRSCPASLLLDEAGRTPEETVFKNIVLEMSGYLRTTSTDIKTEAVIILIQRSKSCATLRHLD